MRSGPCRRPCASARRSKTWACASGRWRALTSSPSSRRRACWTHGRKPPARDGLPRPRAPARPIFTYLANTLRIERPRGARTRSSTAVDGVAPSRCRRNQAAGCRPIVLNEWAARDLGARAGRSSDDGLLPVGGPRPPRSPSPRISPSRPSCRLRPAIATWRPSIPGSAIRRRSDDWDPPFPVDLRRVRPRGRGLLERAPHDAEGVHPAGGRPAAVALAATARSTSIRVPVPPDASRRGRAAALAASGPRAPRSAGGGRWPCATCAARR